MELRFFESRGGSQKAAYIYAITWKAVNSFQAISDFCYSKKEYQKEGRGPLHVKKKEKLHVGTDVVDGGEIKTPMFCVKGTAHTTPLHTLTVDGLILIW